MDPLPSLWNALRESLDFALLPLESGMMRQKLTISISLRFIISRELDIYQYPRVSALLSSIEGDFTATLHGSLQVEQIK